MPIEEVKDQSQQSEPLLKITLPAPPDGNPKSPLNYGAHNAAAQHNFQKVADLFLAVIRNQQMMSQVIANQEKTIKELTKTMDAVSKVVTENIGELKIEENNDGESSK